MRVTHRVSRRMRCFDAADCLDLAAAMVRRVWVVDRVLAAGGATRVAFLERVFIAGACGEGLAGVHLRRFRGVLRIGSGLVFATLGGGCVSTLVVVVMDRVTRRFGSWVLSSTLGAGCVTGWSDRG